MTESYYCYHCRCVHHGEEMRQVLTNGRRRWRCVRSLAGVQASAAQRDAFGRAVSALNQARSLRPLPHCVRELLPRGSEGARVA